jgi:hypothetical protein
LITNVFSAEMITETGASISPEGSPGVQAVVMDYSGFLASSSSESSIPALIRGYEADCVMILIQST